MTIFKKEREKNLVDRKIFKSNIHHKTRPSPFKTRNTGGWHNTVWQFIPEVYDSISFEPSCAKNALSHNVEKSFRNFWIRIRRRWLPKVNQSFRVPSDASVVKFSWRSDQQFLRKVANRQTNRQTPDRKTSLAEVITSGRLQGCISTLRDCWLIGLTLSVPPI